MRGRLVWIDGSEMEIDLRSRKGTQRMKRASFVRARVLPSMFAIEQSTEDEFVWFPMERRGRTVYDIGVLIDGTDPAAVVIEVRLGLRTTMPVDGLLHDADLSDEEHRRLRAAAVAAGVAPKRRGRPA